MENLNEVMETEVVETENEVNDVCEPNEVDVYQTWETDDEFDSSEEENESGNGVGLAVAAGTALGVIGTIAFKKWVLPAAKTGFTWIKDKISKSGEPKEIPVTLDADGNPIGEPEVYEGEVITTEELVAEKIGKKSKKKR